MRPVFGRRYVLGFGSIGRMPTLNRGARTAEVRARVPRVRRWVRLAVARGT